MSFGRTGSISSGLDPAPNRNSSASTPSRATWIEFARLAVLKAFMESFTSLGLSSTSRISARWSVMIWNSRREVECRALINRRFGPDSPAVAMDDALHDREADAGAFEILRAMQPLEHAEQLVGVSHIEASTIVADEDDLFTAYLA